MGRVRALVLLGLGLVVAAAAVGTGPLLVADRQVPPFRLVRRSPIQRVRRPRLNPFAALERLRVAHWIAVLVEVVAAVVVTAIVAFALWHVGRALLRLRLAVLAWFRGRQGTAAYVDTDRDDEDRASRLRERVRDELDLLVTELDAQPDPREAVIACYVRMEAAFATAGSPRRATESPLELLRRVLAEQHVPEADVRRLTDLFTEARFSSHAVDDDMRSAARRSLAAVRDALAVTV